MGAVVRNPGLMPDGKSAPSSLVLYHQGSLPGALYAVLLVPQNHTAIVVMTNSLALCGTPDWVAAFYRAGETVADAAGAVEGIARVNLGAIRYFDVND
jgi:hypothetical protein